jgi:hypothetical protein
VGTWAPGLLAGLIVAALVPYTYVKLTRPVETGKLQFAGEKAA